MTAIDLKLVPVIWEAAGALAGALNETGDYSTARKLVTAVVFQVGCLTIPVVHD